jgi:hypothetical protein
METVTVSSRFQVVIPRKVRGSLDIRPARSEGSSGVGTNIPDGTKIGKSAPSRGAVPCSFPAPPFTGRGSRYFPRYAPISPKRLAHFAASISLPVVGHALGEQLMPTVAGSLPSPLAYLMKELQASAKSM